MPLIIINLNGTAQKGRAYLSVAATTFPSLYRLLPTRNASCATIKVGGINPVCANSTAWAGNIHATIHQDKRKESSHVVNQRNSIPSRTYKNGTAMKSAINIAKWLDRTRFVKGSAYRCSLASVVAALRGRAMCYLMLLPYSTRLLQGISAVTLPSSNIATMLRKHVF